MPALFAEPNEPRTTPLGWIEPAVHWFTESTRPEAAASRQIVNAWYAEIPDPNCKFASRLLSEYDIEHYQAVDELHVHYPCGRRTTTSATGRRCRPGVPGLRQ